MVLTVNMNYLVLSSLKIPTDALGQVSTFNLKNVK